MTDSIFTTQFRNVYTRPTNGSLKRTISDEWYELAPKPKRVKRTPANDMGQSLLFEDFLRQEQAIQEEKLQTKLQARRESDLKEFYKSCMHKMLRAGNLVGAKFIEPYVQLTNEFYDEAIQSNNVRALDYLWDKGLKTIRSGPAWCCRPHDVNFPFFASAVKHGSFVALQWGLEKKIAVQINNLFYTICNPSSKDHVRMFQDIERNTNPWVIAAATGRLDILDWLRTNVPDTMGRVEEVFVVAGGSDLATLRFVAEMDNKLNRLLCGEAFLFAAKAERMENIEWLMTKQCIRSPRVCAVAAESGSFEFVKALHSKLGFPLELDTLEVAVRRYGVEEIEWVYEEVKEYFQEREAVSNIWRSAFRLKKWNNIRALKHYGLPLPLCNGGLLTLMDKDCPWDIYNHFMDGKRGIYWLFYTQPADEGDLEGLRRLEALYHPIKSSIVFDFAAGSGNIQLLEHLRVQGYPCSSQTAYRAAMNDRVDALVWLRSHGAPMDMKSLLENARKSGSVRSAALVSMWIAEGESGASRV
jgi:hypothetical protein